jgi:gas vesicle protein
MTESQHAHVPEPGFRAGNGHGAAFLKGLVGGAVIGAAAGLICAVQVHAAVRMLRRQLTAASDSATERYREVTAQVGGAFDDFSRTARDLLGNPRTLVGRGAGVKEPASVAHTELDRNVARAARRSSRELASSSVPLRLYRNTRRQA